MRYYFLDIKPCHVNPCKNGGSCIVNGGSFQCHCMQGYTGFICEGKINFSIFLWKYDYKFGKLLTNESQQHIYFLDHLNDSSYTATLTKRCTFCVPYSA